MTTNSTPEPRSASAVRQSLAAAIILLACGASMACSPPRPVSAHGSTPAVTMATSVDRKAVHLGGDGLVRAEIVLRGRAGSAAARSVPTDLVVVFDRSGSMRGAKIEHAKASVRELIAQLGAGDRFGLVSYASDVTLDVRMETVSAAARERWLAAVGRMYATTNTNMSGALDVAVSERRRTRQAGRVGRIILVSDGLANEGDPSPEGLRARARSVAMSEDVLTAIGVGMDFDEQLMTSLADAGTGNFYFVEDATRLAGVFSREFEAARETVATGVAVTVRPMPGVRLVDAAGYPLEWSHGAATFRAGSVFAGQERRVWLTLLAPTGRLGDTRLASLALVAFAEGEGALSQVADLGTVACVADESQAIASLDAPTWSRGVTDEQYRAMQQAVALAVKEGRQADAVKHIEGYVTITGAQNSVVGSKDVDRSLEDARRLEAEVNDAFTGANQAEKQSRSAKSNWSSAQDGRRRGAKKQ